VLYAIILLTDFYPTIHPKEMVLICWIFTLFTEEIRQVYTHTLHCFVVVF